MIRIVIPSANPVNLVQCIGAIRDCEPQLPPSSIIVVDDGARASAEFALPSVTWIDGVKPFVFARNANRGIAAAGDADVILLNDDARLIVPGGFSDWAAMMQRWHPVVGLASAAIRGVVCNPQQQAGATPNPLQIETRILAFVCVYLPRAVRAIVGVLDERFDGYGYDDFDYCTRVRQAGFALGIWGGCVVEHGGDLPSSFRTRPDILELAAHNRALYRAKWTADAPP